MVVTTFLIIIISPLVFSQEEISWESNVEDTLGIVQAQATSQKEGEIVPEILGQQATPKNNKQDVPVILDGETLFNVSSKIKDLPAKDRAEEVSRRIEEVAKNSAISIDSIKIVEFEGLNLIKAEDKLLFVVTKSDAKVANRPLDELAQSHLQKAKEAIAQYREERSTQRLVQNILRWVFDTTVAIVLLILLRKIFKRINRRIEVWRGTRIRPLSIRAWQLLSVEQEANLILRLVKLIYWAIIAVISFLYLAAIFHYFPKTKIWGEAILSSFLKVLGIFGKSLLAYLPNLFSILLTIVVAYYIFRFCRLFFNAIETETLSLPGFDQDWARPTERLVVFLICALTLAIILPLLPGAQSPAFRGLSIFVGALFTLGGASAIANIVGGVVIIYTRAFRVGDRVQIADVQGDILEKTILSTRIRTPKNKIVTIPNANLITSNIENFTTAARDINEPMIVYTTITLGYDVPWRHVHQVLIDAALSSPSIL
ncbi:MAG: mechanosensitive ion channel domain-containing protein [Waterburya sp.]